jgi:hypothetical protein
MMFGMLKLGLIDLQSAPPSLWRVGAEGRPQYTIKKFGLPTNQVSPRRRESISKFFAEKMSESIFVQGIGGQM